LTLLVVPAVISLITAAGIGRRRLLAADMLATVCAVLMVVAPLYEAGTDIAVSVASQALEFFGAYAIGRAFFFGRDALQTFARALATVLVLVTGLALADALTRRFIVAEAIGVLLNPPGGVIDGSDPHYHRFAYGVNLIRATSTFDHPILFGAFCSVTAAILAYAHFDRTRRAFFLATAAFGCILTVSSAPMLALTIVGSAFSYDRLLAHKAWRWKALMLALGGAIGLLCLLSDSPMTWVIRHLTFDPSTGYFRLLIWNAASAIISRQPWTGNGFKPTGDIFLDTSVDSLWLSKALSYGLPVVVTLLLLSLSVLIPVGGQAALRRREPLMDRFCIGMSMAVVLFDIIGLTVYFWNAIWLYYSLCLGIRASLKEYWWNEARRLAPVRRGRVPTRSVIRARSSVAHVPV
jgi:hypothetical protein